MGTLVEAARGCRDAAVLFGAPFISGKDSLNNEYLGTDGQRHAIPPTLLISAIGLIEDVGRAITMDLKRAGNDIYLVGKFQPSFGGSHFALVTPGVTREPVPIVDESSPRVYAAVHQAMNAGLVRSAHDISEGGLAVAAAEMCIGGRLGMQIDPDGTDLTRTIFAETTGCLLVEIAPRDSAAFELQLARLPFLKIGTVTTEPILRVADAEILLNDLIQSFNTYT
jgi:phosphoribosylformylglycinamidine synthase